MKNYLTFQNDYFFLRFCILFCIPFYFANSLFSQNFYGGDNNSYWICEDGTLHSSGHNFNGAVGDGSFVVRTFPIQVSNLSNVTQVTANSAHVLAISNGDVWGWGNNFSGQLGNGTIGNNAQRTPVQTLGLNGSGVLSNIVDVSTGSDFSLAIDANGNAYSWGHGYNGQLGNGLSTSNFPIPIRNSSGTGNLTGVFDIEAGRAVCGLALLNDSTVYSWGQQVLLGAGTLVSTNRNLPAHVVGPTGVGTVLDRVVDIAVGHHHALAVRDDGTVYSWGQNKSSAGELGIGSNINFDQYTPIQITGLSNIVAVAAGYVHSLALDASGNVWAWGDNSLGQLGDGTNTDRYAPVKVIEGSNATFLNSIVEISCGHYHSMAFSCDNVIWTWGKNYNGTLGIGNASFTELSATEVDSIKNHCFDFQVDLGANTCLTPYDSMILDATVPSTRATYLWSDGSTNPTLKVVMGASHISVSVQVTIGCEIINDDIFIRNCNLGNSNGPIYPHFESVDTVICAGECVNLINLTSGIPMGYEWSIFGPENHNSTQFEPRFCLQTPGLYSVLLSVPEVNTPAYRFDYIRVLPSPTVELGNDTVLCAGEKLLLNAPFPNGRYIWQDGSTNSSFDVNSGGLYSVEVALSNGCSVMDFIEVIYMDSTDLLGPDISICSGSDTLLSVPDLANVNYTWPNGSNGLSYLATSDGLVKVNATSGRCLTYDSVAVEYYDVPVVNIAPQIICQGQCTHLSLNSDECLQDYEWYYYSSKSKSLDLTREKKTSSPEIRLKQIVGEDAIICVGPLSTTTTYFVSYTTCDGCTFMDSIVVKVLSAGNPRCRNVQSMPSSCCGSIGTKSIEITGNEQVKSIISSMHFIQAYPNPTDGIVNIEFSLDHAQPVRIRVSNLLGELIHEQLVYAESGRQSTSFSMDNYSLGVYLLELIGENKRYNQKIILE